MQYPYNPVNPQNVQIAFTNSGLDLLMRIPSIYVRQRPDYLEAAGFCEKKNVYYVYSSDAEGTKPDYKREIPIFKCKEESSCWQRNYLPGACRAFEMKVKQYDERQDTHTVIRMSREYKLTFLCLGRYVLDLTIFSPMLEVYTDQGAKIGQIFYPFRCCDKGVIVQDNDGRTIYTVMGSCCQWPFLVNLPCETCQKAVFQVTDEQGELITEIHKDAAGCCEAMCTDATNFKVVFPMNTNPTQRALLLGTTIFLDMNYFETSPQDKQNNGID